MQKCVLVVGMHRSGTSLMAGALRILGVDFGEKFLGYDVGNVKGHFEHVDILDANNAILAAFDSSWDDPRPLPDRWFEDPRVVPHRARIRNVITGDFAGSPLFGMKEPRVSLLLPVYRKVLQELSVEPLFVVMERPFGEIAESLYARDKMPAEKALALCQKYLDAVEDGTRGARTVRIEFEAFLKDPRAGAAKIQSVLDVALKNYESVRSELEEFVDPGLKHFRAGQWASTAAVRNRFTRVIDTVLPFNTRRRKLVKTIVRGLSGKRK